VHLAFEPRLHRADLGDGDRLQLGVGYLVELLAAGDAGFQYLGVVELGIYNLAAGWELNLPSHDHRHRRLLLAHLYKPWATA
jgi:hypothetical protein